MFQLQKNQMETSESIDVPAHVLSDESSGENSTNDSNGPQRSKLAQHLTKRVVSRSLAKVSSVNGDCVPLARAHWVLLSKDGAQAPLCRHMFVRLLKKYPQTRPMWQFTKDINFAKENWTEVVQRDNRFKHHCASIQAGVTMIMNCLDDVHGLDKMLRDIGAHHCFYGASEPHFELMHEAFMEALNLTHPAEEELARGWNQIWEHIKGRISIGLEEQRNEYLSECVTSSEMASVESMWENVRNKDLAAAGQTLTREALRAYENLLITHNIDYPIDLPEQSVAFGLFAEEVIKALDTTIDSYSPALGFRELPERLKGFVTTCLMMEVCPTLIRKAFMEGLMKMLTDCLGNDAINEVTQHAWSKVYRMLEQAIIRNVVNY